MASFLEKLAQELPEDELASYKEKVDNVKSHWASLKDILGEICLVCLPTDSVALFTCII